MSAADDRDEIRALVHSYPRLLDAGDLDGVADLFADATLVTGDGQRFSGRETLRGLWDGVQLYDGSPRVHHLVTNVDVRLGADGISATATSYVTVVQALPDFPLQLIAAGSHHDTFAKVDGQWRFTERRDVPDLFGDLSRHFRAP